MSRRTSSFVHRLVRYQSNTSLLIHRSNHSITVARACSVCSIGVINRNIPISSTTSHHHQHCCHRFSYQQTPPSTMQRTFTSTHIGILVHGTIPPKGLGIAVGQYAERRRVFTQHDVSTFSHLIGDYNPVHFPSTQQDTAAYTSNQKPIVHGILLSSLFSSIYATLVPGAIYRSQSLNFVKAVHVDEEFVGRVEVIRLKQVSRKGGGVMCTCETTVYRAEDKMACVSGEAQVWLPSATVVRH